MNTIVLSLLVICYSLMLGIIFAQVLLTAPVVFKVLDEKNASLFLRKIFPRYYLLLFLISIISTLVSYLFFEIFDFYVSAIAALIAFLGYVIIPFTNLARDRGWDSMFKWLHNLSVFNTLIIMVIAIMQIIRITTL